MGHWYLNPADVLLLYLLMHFFPVSGCCLSVPVLVRALGVNRGTSSIVKGLVGVKAPELDLRYLAGSNMGKLLTILLLKWQREISVLAASIVYRSYSLNCGEDLPRGAAARSMELR